MLHGINSISAYLYKDIKLFINKAGIITLLFPIVLYIGMFFGFKDFSGANVIQPFPIAIQDQDQTIMSRTLIKQMKKVELFSEVKVLRDGASPESAFDSGVVAVVTIPKDYFYALYTVEDCPVQCLVNYNNPIGSKLFTSVFTSIMGIVASDESAMRGAYNYIYKDEIDDVIRSEINEKSSLLLLDDALGRQRIFDSQITEKSKETNNEIYSIISSLFLIVVLGMMITGLKTIPEERKLGIIPRIEAMGGSSRCFLVSKFITVFLMLLPVIIGIFLLVPHGLFIILIPFMVTLIFMGFIEIYIITEIFKDSRSIQLCGNIFLLLLLIAGGTLWSRAALPGVLRRLSFVSISYHMANALTITPGSLEDINKFKLISSVTELAVTVILLIMVLGLIRIIKKSGDMLTGPGYIDNVKNENKDGRLFNHALLNMLLIRVKYVYGNIFCPAAIILVAFLLFGIVDNAVNYRAESVVITVEDKDNTHESQALLARLKNCDSLTIQDNSQSDHSGFLDRIKDIYRNGNVLPEGHLIIEPGFGNSISNVEEFTVHYESEGKVFSTQSTREIIASEIIAEQSFYKARKMAEEKLGKKLSASESHQLALAIEDFRKHMPAIYTMSSMGGEEKADPFIPDAMALSFLVVTLFSFTLTAVYGNRDAKAASIRIKHLLNGRNLSLYGDVIPVQVVLCLIQFSCLRYCNYLSISVFAACILYTLLITMLGLLVAGKTHTEGRVDGLACFIAMFLCLLGGCFININDIEGAVHYVTWLSPVGLAQSTIKGEWQAAILLCIENILLFFSIY
ncbi:ABC transporter permease [Oribacterium sp. FC2011]|uniref:ABC transporter permease n=1 Tax=Oribacterium sp. FC2011 TaxID=1408311 RepID=UPI0004E1C91F|nr:ABC transporter permease [Oribacterium sp. FC2011]